MRKDSVFFSKDRKKTLFAVVYDGLYVKWKYLFIAKIFLI